MYVASVCYIAGSKVWRENDAVWTVEAIGDHVDLLGVVIVCPCCVRQLRLVLEALLRAVAANRRQ